MVAAPGPMPSQHYVQHGREVSLPRNPTQNLVALFRLEWVMCPSLRQSRWSGQLESLIVSVWIDLNQWKLQAAEAEPMNLTTRLLGWPPDYVSIFYFNFSWMDFTKFHSLQHSLAYEKFMQHLLWGRYCVRHRRYKSEQGRRFLLLWSLWSRRGERHQIYNL